MIYWLLYLEQKKTTRVVVTLTILNINTDAQVAKAALCIFNQSDTPILINSVSVQNKGIFVAETKKTGILSGNGRVIYNPAISEKEVKPYFEVSAKEKSKLGLFILCRRL